MTYKAKSLWAQQEETEGGESARNPLSTSMPGADYYVDDPAVSGVAVSGHRQATDEDATSGEDPMKTMSRNFLESKSFGDLGVHEKELNAGGTGTRMLREEEGTRDSLAATP
eukprot:1894152-Pyramimonas_sp.AAC.1